MAAPTVFNSVATNPGGTGSTITVALSTHAVDDILIIYIANTGSSLWAGNPAGWSRIDQRAVGTSGNGIVGSWFWHKVVSGDTIPLTNPVFTLGATVTRAAICRTVRGADLESPFVTPSYGARGFATGTANPIRPPSVTTLAPEMLVLHCYGQRSATNAPEPTSYTQDQEVVISGTLVLNASERTVADQNTALTNQDASPTSGVRWAAGILCIPSVNYPYYRSGSQATTASGTSVTPTKPTGTTNSDARGNADIMIATVEGSGSTTLAATDSGLWTPLGGAWTGPTSGGGSSVKKFWAKATASPNMQFTRTGTGEISACITTYYNCNQTNPIGVFDADARASSTTSTFDAITRGAARSLVQATCVADAVPTFISPSGWTERMDGLGISCSDQIYNAAGSSASASFTLSSASPTLVGLLELLGVASGGIVVTPAIAALTTASFAPKLNLAVTPSTTSLSTVTFAPVIKLGVIPATISLTTSTFAPQANLAVIPTTLVITTTTFTAKLSEATIPGTKALVLSTFAPRLALQVVPPSQSLTITSFVPTVLVSANVAVVPDTASLSTTTFAPALRLNVTPAAIALSTSLFAPTANVSNNISVIPSTQSLTTSAFAPSLALNIVPATQPLVTTGFAPAVNVANDFVVSPDVVSLTTSSFAPTVTVSSHISVVPTSAELALSTFAPAVSLPHLVTPITASLSLSAFAPSVLAPELVTPNAGTLTLATSVPDVTVSGADVTVLPGTLALSLSPFSPTIVTPLLATPATLSLSLSVFAPNVSVGSGGPITVTPQTLSLTIAFYAPSVVALHVRAFINISKEGRSMDVSSESRTIHISHEERAN